MYRTEQKELTAPSPTKRCPSFAILSRARPIFCKKTSPLSVNIFLHSLKSCNSMVQLTQTGTFNMCQLSFTIVWIINLVVKHLQRWLDQCIHIFKNIQQNPLTNNNYILFVPVTMSYATFGHLTRCILDLEHILKVIKYEFKHVTNLIYIYIYIYMYIYIYIYICVCVCVIITYRII